MKAALSVWLIVVVAVIIFVAFKAVTGEFEPLEDGRTLELISWTSLVIVLIALGCEFVDSTLGMGYGTTLTPVLILFGFHPLQVIPVVLLSELVTGISAGFAHHAAGNIDIRPGTRAFNVAIVLAACSTVGTVVAVIIAVSIPKIVLNTWIGALIFAIGVLILINVVRRATVRFSWPRVLGIGTVASFNKGMSGGGYGPLVCGGQLLSGIEGKNAVAITSIAEGLTCIVGVTVYIIAGELLSWRLALLIVIGALLSVPLSAVAVRKTKTRPLTIAIGVITTALGIFTLVKIYLL
ncbi:MAG: sulfite exporter TauE/SafE family protein [Candidatus Coatesbacteria bacterium]|nr:MAG: sulfite exporter TauE/SafE family protein [Candidatus Coatesbacteria bacterium]